MITAETIRQALACGEPGCTCGNLKGHVHCPAHDDKTPSLSVTNGGSGKPLVKCFGGCSQDRVISALKARDLWDSPNGDGVQAHKPRIVATYDYHDAVGKLIFQVCRKDNKEFPQRRPDGKGGWIWNLDGVDRVPYRLPELLKADTVVIAEGEKDCNRLAAMGFAATCNPGGAGNWQSEYNPHFQGKAVVIFPDNDPKGKTHAQDVARNLQGVAASVKVVDLPGLPEKGDVSDWIKAGGTKAGLLTLADQAPEWRPLEGKQPSIADLVCDVSAFISIEFPLKRTFINPWLSESTINMIYGPRGIGKTMFVLGILGAATTGEPFGPWQVNNPIPCFYLDGEMAPQDTQNRLNRFPSLKNQDRQPLIIYCDAQMNQYGLSRANLLDDEWRKVMKQLLLANDIKLWVADNIASLAPGIDENSKQDWDPINQWFLELRFAGITTIFLHHASKDGGQRGTSGREDNIDISIFLDRPRNYAPEDGARFIVKFQKARIEHKYLPLITDTEFALESDEEENYFWTYGTVKKQHKTQILTLLDEGMKATDIASELGINKSRVSQIKAEAVKDNLITKEGKLTQSGFAYVSKN